MKNYYCFVTDKPDGYERDTFYFITESGDVTRNLRLSINDTDWSMQSWFFTRKDLFAEKDVCAIRFLPQGIGLVRRNKYLSSHESNPWPALFVQLDIVLSSQYEPENGGFNVNYEALPSLSDSMSDAFDRTGVWLKPGKFAKMMGSTDVEAEKFSRDYDAMFAEDKMSLYDFSLVSGDDIINCYSTRNYAECNGSQLWSSCMNNKNSIIRFYAKNHKHISMAVLRRDGKIVSRAIVWNDTTISEWGSSSTVCTSDRHLYKGKFADRCYFHNDEALDIMRKYLVSNGIAYKHSTSAGDGEIMIPLDGSWSDFYSSRLLIRANVGFVGGPVPYLDTLSFASSCKSVANRAIEGKLKRCVSTQGGSDRLGEYVKVTLGIDDESTGGPAKYAYRESRTVATIVMPDGRYVYLYGNASRYNAIKASDRSHFYVLSDICKQMVVRVPRVDNWAAIFSDLTVMVYAHQLEYDFDSREFKVVRLYDEKSKSYHPVDEFVIKYVGRGRFNRSLTLIRDKRAARAAWSELAPAPESIQVDVTHPQIQVI